MTSNPSQPARLRFRAPAGSGEVLAVPDLSRCGNLAEANAQLLDGSSLIIGGVPLRELRKRTRQQVLSQADRVAVEWGFSAVDGDAAGLWIVTGHQPVVAHPGVWVKNAQVAASAKHFGGLGLNLIVDSDLCNSREILVPTGTRETPELGSIPFDSPAAAAPWEEARLHDRRLFETAGQRLADHLQVWGIKCMAHRYWKLEGTVEARSLSSLFTQMRVHQERTWGWNNRELPVSSLDQNSGFLRLLAHLIQDAPAFVKHYNAAVLRYRRQNGIRNHSHPVPDLRTTASEFELPFWVWKPGSTVRQGLSVQVLSHAVQLRSGIEILGDAPSGDIEATINALASIRQEFKIRPRALATTLFARLLVADLFVHGIGGAKYDEITDDIIRNYFGIDPPGYLTLTATLRLPIPLEPVTTDDIRQQERDLRDLQFNPDRQLRTEDLAEIQQRKSLLIAEQHAAGVTGLSRRERRARRSVNRGRHQGFADLRAKLKTQVAAESARREALLEQSRLALSRNKILGNREYAAILHPESALLELFSRVQAMVR